MWAAARSGHTYIRWRERKQTERERERVPGGADLLDR